MNYQLIKNEEILNNFIDWLPELKFNETYFIGMFARKKYIELECDRDIIKRKESQIKRFSLNYALIEERFEGIYFGLVPVEWWFKWDDLKRSYQKIQKPEQLKQICSFMS